MFHKVIVAGNLGRDPELRTLPSGQAVCTFPVATNRKWKTAEGEQREETLWFRVSVWGRMGEVCQQYLSKGRPVLIEGRLQPDRESGGPRVYNDKEGVARSSFELTALEVRFLSGNRDNEGEGGRQTAYAGAASSSGSRPRAAVGDSAAEYRDDRGSLGADTDEDMPF